MVSANFKIQRFRNFRGKYSRNVIDKRFKILQGDAKGARHFHVYVEVPDSFGKRLAAFPFLALSLGDPIPNKERNIEKNHPIFMV